MTLDLQTSTDINEIAAALAGAQGEFPSIEKRRQALVEGVSRTSGKPYKLSYAYADIADVLSAVLPVLSKHKLAIVQPTLVDERGMFIKTRLMHASGQWIQSEYPVASVTGDHQRMGGAVTYARRYALCALIGVAADEDVDGQTAEDVAPKRARRAERVMPAGAERRQLPPTVARPTGVSASASGTAAGARQVRTSSAS
jgi:ERF superfamily